MPIKFSTFTSTKSNHPQPQEKTWDEIVEWLKDRTFQDKKEGRELFSPAVYAPNTSRANRNVTEITLAVFDLDELSRADVEAVHAAIQAAGYSYVIYSTHSHQPPNVCCLRVVMPVSRPIKTTEWPKLRAAIEAQLKLHADEATKDLARIFYLPSSPDNADARANAEYKTGAGKPIDVDAFLAIPAPLPVDPGTGSIDLYALRAELRKVRSAKSKPLIKTMLDGAPLATENRDLAMHQAASILVFSLPAETPIEAMIEIARPSIQAMPSDNSQTFELEKFEEKLTRALADKQRGIDANIAFQESRLAKHHTAPNLVPAKPEDVQVWAKEQGCAADAFRKRWIIQRGQAYFVFVDGKYKSPIVQSELDVSLPRDLATAPIDLIRFDAKGNPRQAKTSELLTDYSTVARYLEANLALQKSYYDPVTETFHEAVCPLRALTPKFHPEVDQWLRHLGGQYADKLLDWVASVTVLEKQCAALFLKGEAGAGKGLLAGGLSHLWNASGPTEFASLVSGFNEAITGCPLVLCDEGFPKRRDYSVNDELRRWVGSSERTLNRKYMPAAKLGGCIRLLIAANNDRILDGIEEMSEEDRVAITQRLLCVTVGEEPRKYIEQIAPDERTAWVEYKIAEHALWLRDNRKVTPGARFLVEGVSTEMHDRLSVSNGLAPAVCEFLVNTIMQLNPANAKSLKDVIRVGDGQVMVSARAFADEMRWKMLVPGTKFPDTNSLYRTLSNMRAKQIRVRLDDGTKPTFNIIKHELLLSWARLNGVGDLDVLAERIHSPSPLT